MTLIFIDEKRISWESSVLAFFTGTFGTALLIYGYIMTSTLSFSLGFFIEGGFVSILGAFFVIVSALLQYSILKQWTGLIKTNITNTIKTISIINSGNKVKGITSIKFENRLSKMNIDFRVVYFFLAGYVASLFSSLPGLLILALALVFLHIFLVNIFKIITELESMKTKIYPYLLETLYPDDIYRVPRRNVFGIIVLSFLTLGIYWYYILLVMGTEINEFIEVDSNLRFRVKEKLENLI